TYVLYGRHSLALSSGATSGGIDHQKMPAGRARLALAKAVDLDPRFGEAWALLAVAQLRPGGDLDAALSAIARSRELLPQRLDLVALEVRARLKQGDVDRAAKVLGYELVPFDKDLDRVASLWEDVDRTRLILQSQEAFERGDDDEGLRLFDEAVDLTTDDALRSRLEDELLRLQRQAEGRR
ncbi:MAG: hypothetical protein AAGE94_18080, partial [Acidobacteriota bacterium]